MFRIFKYFFLNYYYFFYKFDSDEKFSMTRALNLILINMLLIAFIFFVLILKEFPELRILFPEIKKYGYVYFIIIIIVFIIHYLLHKKLKYFINSIEYKSNSSNNFIIIFTNLLILLCVVFVIWY